MLFTLNKLIILNLIIFNAWADDLICSKGNIIYTEYQEDKIIKSEFCYNDEKTILLSKKCKDHKCDAFKNQNTFPIDEFLGETGKPGFKLCRKLGGKPQIIKFSVKKDLFKLDRCIFNDGEYADTGYLLEHYIEKSN